MPSSERQLLVFGDRTFKVTIPEGAKVTFGPFSPPTKNGFNENRSAIGTLRIYQGTKENIIACFTGVRGFRDLGLEYMEEVAREEGATIWKSDEHGYMREDKRRGSREWVEPAVPALSSGREEDEEVF